MSQATWSNYIIGMLGGGIFVVAAILIPDMPTPIRVIWIIMGGIIVISTINPMFSSLSRKPKSTQTNLSPETPMKRHTISYPAYREYYNIYDEKGSQIIFVTQKRGVGSNEPQSGENLSLSSMRHSVNILGLTHRIYEFASSDGLKLGTMQHGFTTKYSVNDASGKQSATIRPVQLVEGLTFCIDDSQGRLLAESEVVVPGSGYSVFLPSGKVLAKIASRGGVNTNDYLRYYDVDFYGSEFDSLLIYCFVIAVDALSSMMAGSLST